MKFDYSFLTPSSFGTEPEQFYILLVECFENWPNEVNGDEGDTADFFNSLSKLSESVRKLNLLEPLDLQRKSQYNMFDDLVEKYLEKPKGKRAKDKEVTKEEAQLQKDLQIQINTLQQLKGIFLEFIENVDINEKSTNDFHDMLKEMKDLYNRIIGNKMYTQKNEAIDEVSLVLDVCNRYKGRFRGLQEYVKRGGKWETALSKGIEEGLGRSSFGEKPAPGSRKSQNDQLKELELKFSKFQNSELVKYNTASEGKNEKRASERKKDDFRNPFENSSIEDLKTPGKKEPKEEAGNKRHNQSSSFQHLERNDSAQTMDELKNFIIKEKVELENEVVALKLKLETKDNQILELKVKNEQQATKIKSLQHQNAGLQKQVKEYKEEIYARILNLTMTSHKTGTASLNKFDSSKKIGVKEKYRDRVDTSTPIKRSTSFLSKPEDRIEKTRREPEGMDKKSLANSKAFLQDFNKEIDSILNRGNKPKTETSTLPRRQNSQKNLYRGTDTKRNYLDLHDKKNTSFTAHKSHLRSHGYDPLGKDFDPMLRMRDMGGSLAKVKSQQYFQKDMPLGKETPEMGGGLGYPPRNRMAYTLNLAEHPSYANPSLGMPDYENYNLRGRLDNRPSSFTNDNLYNRRANEVGMLGTEDPRFAPKYEDMGHFRSSMFPDSRFGNPGDTPRREHQGAFDAAKQLEKYKNQMKMKQAPDQSYGGRFY